MHRITLATLAAVSWLACGSAPDGPEGSSRPNIVVMLTDDQGWQDTSEPFADERTPQNDLYRTPNMERLASEGMKFTSAYSNAVCTPTRVELLTGLNQVRTRISNWTHFRDEATDRSHPDLIIPRWNTNGLQPVPDIPLSLHAKTLPQELRAAGYRTIHIGKGHFGTRGTPGADPKALGFDVRIGGRFSGAPGSYYGTDNFASGGDPASTPWRAWDMEKYFGQEIYLTEALPLEAIAAVEEAVALHDLNAVMRWADQVALMNEGRLEAFGPVGDVVRDNFIEPVFGVNVEHVRVARGNETLVFHRLQGTRADA
jgi:arylsulfatase A-like enzyme